MPRITYTLRVEYPEEIDAETLAEINEAASDHDKTLADKIGRWVGGEVSAVGVHRRVPPIGQHPG